MSGYKYTGVPVNCSQICDTVDVKSGSYTISNIPYSKIAREQFTVRNVVRVGKNALSKSDGLKTFPSGK